MSEKDKTFYDLCKEPLDINEKWYIINKDWFQQWENIVKGMESKENLKNITNSVLLNKEKLVMDEILLARNYELVPEKVWEFLVKQYGVDCDVDYDVFARDVTLLHGNYIVEVRPLNLIICIGGKENKIKTRFSRSDTLKDVYDFVEEKFALRRPLRILQIMDNGTIDVIKLKESETLGDAGFKNGEQIFIDTQDENGEWTMRKARNRSANKSVIFGINGKLTDGRVVGICGLCNLGNTCFMNSALQCISNVPPLTYYFVKTNWKNDLNVNNPLGMQGKLAERYYELLEQIWIKGATYTVPRDFKVEVAKFAPQFSGYAQHDSQELMMFLLDGLHEDLNRIQKKPYVESKDDDKLSIIKKAENSWKYHQMRNDSIIVENFHGLLKSTVVCPDCNYVSVTFDPFASLSLPLVITYPQLFTIKLQHNAQFSDKHTFFTGKVMVSKTDNIKHFINRVKQIFSICKKSSLQVTEIQNGRINRSFYQSDSISCLRDLNNIVIHELTPLGNNDEWIEVYMQVQNGPMFGVPTLIPINRTSVDWYSLKTRIFHRMPFLNKILNGVVDSDGINKSVISNSINSDDINPKAVYNEYERISFIFNLYLIQKHSKDYYLLSPESSSRSLNLTGIYQIMMEWTKEGKEKFYDLQFEKPIEHESIALKQSPLTIESCMTEFIRQEKLGINDLWYCKMCKAQKAATKKFDLWHLPKVLVLHLKRFRSGYYRRDKIDTFVDFPINDLDLRKFVENAHFDANDQNFHSCYEKYDLVAISNHMGGLGGGHYTAFAKNFIDNNWYIFDDSHTSKVSEENIKTKAAYVLVYVSQSALEEIRGKLFSEVNGDDEMDIDYTT